MSGGHFNYEQFHIEQIADEVLSLITNNNSKEIDPIWNQPIGRNYSMTPTTGKRESKIT